MRLSIILAAVTLVFSVSKPVFADGTPIADLIHGPGELVFMKPEFVPGRTDSGILELIREVTYQGDLRIVHPDSQHMLRYLPGKMDCLAEFITSQGTTDPVPGIDVNIPAGAKAKWDVKNFPPYYHDQLTDNGSNKYVESFTVYFYGGEIPMPSISCTVTHDRADAKATVADFEEATGGRMTLQAVREN